MVMLNCPPWNTAPLRGQVTGNIEVFMNETIALAVKVVVAAVREALLFASLAALHVESFELSINDIFLCCL